jgi:hypothetical protein
MASGDASATRTIVQSLSDHSHRAQRVPWLLLIDLLRAARPFRAPIARHSDAPRKTLTRLLAEVDKQRTPTSAVTLTYVLDSIQPCRRGLLTGWFGPCR